jgi:hypothetical protein
VGQLIDLDERRQIKALQALLDSMARLVKVTRRYGQAVSELHRAAQDAPAAADPPPPASPPPGTPEPER